MTTPVTPDAYDPTATIRDLYEQAELRLLDALTQAVAAGLAEDATDTTRATAERRLTQQARAIVAELNDLVPTLVNDILDAARAEGEARADE